MSFIWRVPSFPQRLCVGRPPLLGGETEQGVVQALEQRRAPPWSPQQQPGDDSLEVVHHVPYRAMPAVVDQLVDSMDQTEARSVPVASVPALPQPIEVFLA